MRALLVIVGLIGLVLMLRGFPGVARWQEGERWYRTSLTAIGEDDLQGEERREAVEHLVEHYNDARRHQGDQMLYGMALVVIGIVGFVLSWRARKRQDAGVPGRGAA